MATQQAATVSSGAQLHDGHDVDALRKQFQLGGLSLTVDDDNHVSLHGYHSIGIYDGDEQRCDELFFSKLAKQLADGEELIVQSVGFTKLRFPAYAVEYRLTPDGVTIRTLGEEPRDVTVTL